MYKIPYTKYLEYKMQDTFKLSISDTRYKILSGMVSEILDTKYVSFKYFLKIKYFCKKTTFY